MDLNATSHLGAANGPGPGPLRQFQGLLARSRENRLVRSVATLAGGSALAEAVSLVTAPIITRLYNPADYGLAAVFASIIGVLTILATFRFEVAILLAENESESRATLLGSLILVCLASAVTALAARLGGEWVFTRLGAPGLYQYWWMLPMSLLGAGFYQSFYHWALRAKQYGALTRTRIQQTAGGALTKIAVGSVMNGPLGLLLGTFLSASLGIGRLAPGTLRGLLASDEIPLFRRILRAYRARAHFALLNTGAGLLHSVSLLAPPLLLSALFDQQTVGWFALAQRVVLLPGSLLGAALGQVIFAEASERFRDRPAEVPAFFRSVIRKTGLVALCPLLLGLACPLSFPVLFGERWQPAGVFAAVLSIPCSLQLAVSPIWSIAILRQRQDLQLALEGLHLVMAFGLIWAPARLGADAFLTVGCYAAGTSLVHGLYYALYSRLVRSPAVRTPGTPCLVSGGI